VVNDAAGNATGWCLANFCIWCLLGVVSYLQPYHTNLQYGTTNPVMLAFGGWFMCNSLCWLFSKLEVWNHRREEVNDSNTKKLRRTIKNFLKHRTKWILEGTATSEEENAEADIDFPHNPWATVDPNWRKEQDLTKCRKPEEILKIWESFSRLQRWEAKRLKYEKLAHTPAEIWIDKHSKGFFPTMVAWMLGYLVYNLLQLIAFLAARSPTELDRMRCATGFTAYTPNYPEGQNLYQIFALTPFSPFGVATLVTAVLITKLSHAKFNMCTRVEKKKLMFKLHRLINRNRLVHYRRRKIAEKRNGVSAGGKPRAFKTSEIKINTRKVDLAIVELGDQPNDHLETIMDALTEKDEDLRTHAVLVKARINANLFMEILRANEADYYAIAIGLSFETVIDAVTEYWSSCEFSHNQGSPEYIACTNDSPLEVSLRVVLSDFIAAMGFLVVIIALIATFERFGLNAEHEKEEKEEKADSDSSSDEEYDMEQRHHDMRHAPARHTAAARQHHAKLHRKKTTPRHGPSVHAQIEEMDNLEANPISSPGEDDLSHGLLSNV